MNSPCGQCHDGNFEESNVPLWAMFLLDLWQCLAIVLLVVQFSALALVDSAS